MADERREANKGPGTKDQGPVVRRQPDNFEIRVMSGRKSAITMKPMMPPRMTIMIGYSSLTKLSTAVSTSSS